MKSRPLGQVGQSRIHASPMSLSRMLGMELSSAVSMMARVGRGREVTGSSARAGVTVMQRRQKRSEMNPIRFIVLGITNAN
ncbi:MAG: hypothetical protein RLZZ251_218 [Actinomycetota bacterium]